MRGPTVEWGCDRKHTMRISPVEQFEAAISEKLGIDHAYAFWNGRTALYALLKALGIGPGDEVVMPAYTCWSAVVPILWVGAKPVYVDIDAHSLNMDAGLLEGALTPATRAVIVQHTFGRRNDVRDIQRVNAEHNVLTIEDATHCVVGERGGGLSAEVGIEAAYWSFGWGKPLELGIGGLVTTTNGDLAESLRELQRAASQRPLSDELAVAAYKKYYDFYRQPAIRRNIDRTARVLSRFRRSPGKRRTGHHPISMEGQLERMGRTQARSGCRHIDVSKRKRLGSLWNSSAITRFQSLPEDASTHSLGAGRANADFRGRPVRYSG